MTPASLSVWRWIRPIVWYVVHPCAFHVCLEKRMLTTELIYIVPDYFLTRGTQFLSHCTCLSFSRINLHPCIVSFASLIFRPNECNGCISQSLITNVTLWTIGGSLKSTADINQGVKEGTLLHKLLLPTWKSLSEAVVRPAPSNLRQPHLY